MADKAHGNKAQPHEKGGVGKEHLIADVLHESAGQDRGDDLGGHGGGVVVPGELAHIAAPAHLHHHGQAVDVDSGPRKTHQGKRRVHHGRDGGGVGGHHIARQEAGRQQHHARHNGLLPPHPGGRDADGDVGDDGAHSGHHEAGSGAADTLPHDLGDIGGEPGGHAVVARVPQGDGGQQEQEAPLHRPGQHLAAAAVVLRQIPLRMLLLQGAVGRRQPGLPDGQQHDGHCRQHDEGDDDEQGLVVDVVQPLGFGAWIEHRRHTQVQHAAHRAHEVDNGVGLAPQGLGGHVRHQRHRRGAVGAHGDEQKPQDDDKAHQLEGGRLGGVAVVQHGQQVHEHHRRPGAAQNEGGPAAHLGLPAPV